MVRERYANPNGFKSGNSPMVDGGFWKSRAPRMAVVKGGPFSPNLITYIDSNKETNNYRPQKQVIYRLIARGMRV